MNEEEFIEAEVKRIKTVVLLVVIWMLTLPINFILFLEFLAESGTGIIGFLLVVITLTCLPAILIWISGQQKRPYGLWVSWKSLSIITIKYLSLPLLAIILASFELPLYNMIVKGEPYNMSTSDIIPILVILGLSLVFASFKEVYFKRREKYDENRNVLLNLRADYAKNIIIEALGNLNISYHRLVGPFGFSNERKFVELESGIKIGAIPNSKGSMVFISDIPKNDAIEPKIEEEISRLAVLHKSD